MRFKNGVPQCGGSWKDLCVFLAYPGLHEIASESWLHPSDYYFICQQISNCIRHSCSTSYKFYLLASPGVLGETSLTQCRNHLFGSTYYFFWLFMSSTKLILPQEHSLLIVTHHHQFCGKMISSLPFSNLFSEYTR